METSEVKRLRDLHGLHDTRKVYTDYPSKFKTIIFNYLLEYDDSIEEKDDEIFANLDIKGKEFLCIIPKNRAKIVRYFSGIG